MAFEGGRVSATPTPVVLATAINKNRATWARVPSGNPGVRGVHVQRYLSMILILPIKIVLH